MGEAGINLREALGIGISVDRRRKNRSEQSLQANVQRLREYKANLILFPRRKGKVGSGDSTAEECASAVQQTGVLFPVKRPVARTVTVDASEVDSTSSAYVTLRRARADERLMGRRKRRAEMAAEAEALK